MTGLTAALAEFIHVKTLCDFPPEALDKAKKAITDTFAVMLAGAGRILRSLWSGDVVSGGCHQPTRQPLGDR